MLVNRCSLVKVRHSLGVNWCLGIGNFRHLLGHTPTQTRTLAATPSTFSETGRDTSQLLRDSNRGTDWHFRDKDRTPAHTSGTPTEHRHKLKHRPAIPGHQAGHRRFRDVGGNLQNTSLDTGQHHRDANRNSGGHEPGHRPALSGHQPATGRHQPGYRHFRDLSRDNTRPFGDTIWDTRRHFRHISWDACRNTGRD